MIDPKLLIEEFQRRFGARPSHHVVSPGRVNIIGEHTDYNMLPVLPMAINHGLHFVVRASDGPRIRVQNMNPRYHPADFTGAGEIPKGPIGDPANYIKAAVQYTWPQFAEKLGHEPRGFDGLIASDLPPAAGLSSSSATVVGAYLCFCAANNLRLDRDAEPEAMRLAERYVGTASGGMDQATILLGREHKALLIDFDPVRTREVSLPGNIVFFAIDSLQRAAKSGNARFHYNRRTFECQCAVELIRHYVRENGEHCDIDSKYPESSWRYLRDVLNGFRGDSSAAIGCTRAAIREQPWSLTELRSAIGAAADELLQQKMLPPADDEYWNGFEGFKPLQRAVHVIAEAGRVHQCATALALNHLETASGALTESHQSCRDLYEISTPQVEQLVAATLRCGAMAARITGAGFGGSIVAMVDATVAADFRARLWHNHFQQLSPELVREANAEGCILECRPGNGAHFEALA